MAGQAQSVVGSDESAPRTLAIVQELLREYRPRDFAVELWDETRLDPDAGQFCRFTWRINNAGALRAAFASAKQVALAEAYILSEFDISGDMLAIFPLAEHLAERTGARRKNCGWQVCCWLAFPQPRRRTGRTLRGGLHSRARDRQAVSFHYDVSNDFYRLWLDPSMVYSCAYFKSANDSLEARKSKSWITSAASSGFVRTERLLDIGCGWGGLIVHAARKYGPRDRDNPQSAAANSRKTGSRRLDCRRVAKLCCSDYRDAPQLGEFDKLVSVGMVEHVGEGKLPGISGPRSVAEAGRSFLNHGIGRAGDRALLANPPSPMYYVFPDSGTTANLPTP
jgi:cyclopropane-fatty-acyl-phospholipid synthase